MEFGSASSCSGFVMGKRGSEPSEQLGGAFRLELGVMPGEAYRMNGRV